MRSAQRYYLLLGVRNAERQVKFIFLLFLLLFFEGTCACQLFVSTYYALLVKTQIPRFSEFRAGQSGDFAHADDSLLGGL